MDDEGYRRATIRKALFWAYASMSMSGVSIVLAVWEKIEGWAAS